MPDIICLHKNSLHTVLHNYRSIATQINIFHAIFFLDLNLSTMVNFDNIFSIVSAYCSLNHNFVVDLAAVVFFSMNTSP